MKKIESLTPEQEAKLDSHREKWLSKVFNYEFYNNHDKDRTEISMKRLYKFCGLEEPEVLLLDSPMQCQVKVNELVGNKDNLVYEPFSSYINVDVKPFKGRAITTVELIDRSSPAFFNELVRQMEFAYAKETDYYVYQQIGTDGVLNATATTEDKTGLLTYIANAAGAIYKGTLGFARNIVVSPEAWSKIMSYEDGGRPIYIASNPQNNGGVLSPDSVSGTVAGLTLRVDRQITATGNTGLGDYSMVVINPDSYQWFESPRFQLRTNVNSDGTLDLLYYGYGALATKVGAGANWFNKS
jgi:hypothetical protein